MVLTNAWRTGRATKVPPGIHLILDLFKSCMQTHSTKIAGHVASTLICSRSVFAGHHAPVFRVVACTVFSTDSTQPHCPLTNTPANKCQFSAMTSRSESPNVPCWAVYQHGYSCTVVCLAVGRQHWRNNADNPLLTPHTPLRRFMSPGIHVQYNTLQCSLQSSTGLKASGYQPAAVTQCLGI